MNVEVHDDVQAVAAEWDELAGCVCARAPASARVAADAGALRAMTGGRR